jgi:hypothetical protein
LLLDARDCLFIFDSTFGYRLLAFYLIFFDFLKTSDFEKCINLKKFRHENFSNLKFVQNCKSSKTLKYKKAKLEKYSKKFKIKISNF